MTITTQHTEFGGIDIPDDQRPGTLDVRWAEEALRPPGTTDQHYAVRRLPACRRPRRGLRRVIAAIAIAGCLVVGILIAPGNTSPAPRWTPTPARTESRPAVGTSTKFEEHRCFRSLPMPAGSVDEGRRVRATSLFPDLSCLGTQLEVHRTSTTGSGAR